MNRLMLARHGYESLAGPLQRSLNEEVSDKAEEWLSKEVCAVAEELFFDPAFHRLALWSQQHLAPGSEHAERRLVDQVEQALVNFGKIASRIVARDDVGSTSGSPHESGSTAVGFEMATVSLVASRPWFDLVFSADFLHPSQELFLLNPNQRHTEHFRRGPERRVPLGDYVTRMMLARVEYWKTLLDQAFNQIFVIEKRDLPFRMHEELFSAKLGLDQAAERLVHACHDSQHRLREAATSLVQIYIAYAPSPKLEWLLLPPGAPEAHRGLIRSCIRRRGTLITAEQRGGQFHELHRRDASLCDPTVLRQVAAALADVTSLYEVPSGNHELLRWAVDRARLVLVDSRPRAVYWDGQPVAEDEWCTHERQWDLLWTLARNARGVVNQGMLMNPDGQVLRSRRHRLGKLLSGAPTLDELIDSRRGEGYFLMLDADTVICLRNQSGQLMVA